MRLSREAIEKENKLHDSFLLSAFISEEDAWK